MWFFSFLSSGSWGAGFSYALRGLSRWCGDGTLSEVMSLGFSFVVDPVGAGSDFCGDRLYRMKFVGWSPWRLCLLDYVDDIGDQFPIWFVMRGDLFPCRGRTSFPLPLCRRVVQRLGEFWLCSLVYIVRLLVSGFQFPCIWCKLLDDGFGVWITWMIEVLDF